MAKRGFVCLRCGRQYHVEKEVYEAIRDNPVCASCRQKNEAASQSDEMEADGGTVAAWIALAQKGVQALARTKKPADKGAEDVRRLPDPPTLEEAPFDPRKSISERPSTSGSEVLSAAARTISNLAAAADPVDAELSWQHIGCLGELYDHHKEILSRYHDCVGLYMHKINGRIMYIGRAVEYNNGGFRKRLSDYCRDSDSARKHPSGQKIYANRYRIQTYVMVVGKDREAAERTKLLEKQYIARHNPPWNDKLKEE